MMRKIATDAVSRRARLSIHEIALALVLTLAALAFVVAALRGPKPETASIMDNGPSSVTPASEPISN